AGDVDDVVDVEAVTGTLLIPDASDRPIQAVAEPVRRERHDDAACGPRCDAIAGERQSGERHGDQTQRREVIGADEVGEPTGDPNEELLLRSSENAQVLASMRACSHGCHEMPPPGNADLDV